MVAVLVVLGVALLAAAGVRHLSDAAGEKYRAQGDAIRQIGRAPSRPRTGDFPEPPREGSSSDVISVGTSFGGAAATTFLEGVEGLSNMVNPFHQDFAGARINRASLALLNLAMNPSEQIEREVDSVHRMWSGITQAASGARDTISDGSATEQAALAGAFVGMMFDPFKGAGKASRLSRLGAGARTAEEAATVAQNSERGGGFFDRLWGRRSDADDEAGGADTAAARRADGDRPGGAPERPVKDTSARTSSAAREHLADAGIRGARGERLLESFADAGISADEVMAMSTAQLRALRRADAALAARRMEPAIRNLDEAGLSGQRLTDFETALARRHDVTSPSFYRNPTAIGQSGKELPPDSYGGGYYGAGKVDPDGILRRGLPARGHNRSLEEHALGSSDTAYRGTTPYPVSPDGDSGAVLWADEGGYVFEVDGVPTWDVNKHLEGGLDRSGFKLSNPVRGEVEHMIPGHVPPERIKRYGQVVESRSGRQYVKEWLENPRYRPRTRRSGDRRNAPPPPN